MLIPCRPRAFDLAAIEATAELVKSSRNPAFVVFNAGPPRAPVIYKEAADLVAKGFGLTIAPIILPERAAFHHSSAAGHTAPEHDGESKAADEIRALWRWTREQLDTTAGEHVNTGEPAREPV